MGDQADGPLGKKQDSHRSLKQQYGQRGIVDPRDGFFARRCPIAGLTDRFIFSISNGGSVEIS